MKNNRLILIFPVMTGILFGTAGIFVRYLTAHGFDNPTIIFARTSVATLILLAHLLVHERRIPKVRIKDLWVLACCGLVGMLGTNLAYNLAITSVTLSLAAVLLSMSPIFVMLLSALFFREKFTARKAVSLVLMVLGCILVSGILEQNLTLSGKGVAMGIAAAFFYAVYSVVSRIASERGYTTVTLVFYCVLIIMLATLPLADLGAIRSFVAEAPLNSISVLLLHTLCTSVLPYIFLTIAVSRADTGIVSILASGTEPVAAMVFGVLAFSEVPTVLMIGGLVIVIAALIIPSLGGAGKTGERPR